MSDAIINVKLELLRPGPAHNQLLSPLTPYIALCGGDGPVTVRIPFEHRQLLIRLRRLRYVDNNDPAKDVQRQAELRDIGEAIGNVLAQIPALLAELGNNPKSAKLIHLRLAMSGFELGMLPFEAAIAPDGFPGSGSPLFLQKRLPITVTREIRRGLPLKVEWNKPPRILFAFAAPAGSYVPFEAHLQALREAIEPWVALKGLDTDRLPEIKKLLTVMPDASLEKIREECAQNSYTHVHILAHGAPFTYAGEERFGLALCSDKTQQADIVDGERLGIALTGGDTCNMKAPPTVVSLATCDSGNIDTVITPGGSIAHELNAAGIPWVIASQFPLWMKASAIAAHVLYQGFLNGKDPRCVLYDLRQQLRMNAPETHDWASIVAYATVPWDFVEQVNQFRDKQTRSKLEVKFARMDDLVGANKINTQGQAVALTQEQNTELNALCQSIRADLKQWREEQEAMVSDKIKAERLGMSAASEKRIAIIWRIAENTDEHRTALLAARDFYEAALRSEPCNHWVLTQFLFIVAIVQLLEDPTNMDSLSQTYGEYWITAHHIADMEYRKSSGNNKVWALSTLTELNLLGSVYAAKESFERKASKANIKRYCKEMLTLLTAEAFPIQSTKRQFWRYLNFWPNKNWDDLAKEALKALGDKVS